MSLPVEKRRQWIKSRREQRKLTKYARLRRQILRYFVLMCLLLASIFAFNHIQCHISDNKDGLIIEGNTVASNDQISTVFRSELVNTPIFFLNPSELENKVKKLSIIKHAFVRRYLLPHPLIKVAVLEEFPWATIYSIEPSPNNSNCSHPPISRPAANVSNSSDTTSVKAQFVLSESGRLIAIEDFPNVYQPSLKIYTANRAQLHLSESEIEKWANWLSYISKQMQCPVLALDMREPHNIKVETSRLMLVLGNPDSGLTRRLERLASVLEVLANQNKEPTYVNLALNSNIPVKIAKKSDKNANDEKYLAFRICRVDAMGSEAQWHTPERRHWSRALRRGTKPKQRQEYRRTSEQKRR